MIMEATTLVKSKHPFSNSSSPTCQTYIRVIQKMSVKLGLLVQCFYDWFGFSLTRLAFSWFGLIGLALSGSLCIVVDLGIDCVCS